MAQAPKVKGNGDWWRTNEGIEAKGRELGIPAKRGEPWPEYKARLFAAMHAVAPIATGTGA